MSPRRRLSPVRTMVMVAGLGLGGCSGAEVTEDVDMNPPRATKSGLPTWEDVESGHPEGATNPPSAVLIVATNGLRCWKEWVGAEERGPGNRVEDCATPCGTEIQCPEERATNLLIAHAAANLPEGNPPATSSTPGIGKGTLEQELEQILVLPPEDGTSTSIRAMSNPPPAPIPAPVKGNPPGSMDSGSVAVHKGKVELGTLAFGPDRLDDPGVRNVVNKRRGSMMSCVEAGLKSDPNLAGRVRLAWTITAGRVSAAQVLDNSTGSSAVGECLSRTIRSARFDVEVTGEVAELAVTVGSGE